jgi:hypothetical protein
MKERERSDAFNVPFMYLHVKAVASLPFYDLELCKTC